MKLIILIKSIIMKKKLNSVFYCIIWLYQAYKLLSFDWRSKKNFCYCDCREANIPCSFSICHLNICWTQPECHFLSFFPVSVSISSAWTIRAAYQNTEYWFRKLRIANALSWTQISRKWFRSALKELTTTNRTTENSGEIVSIPNIPYRWKIVGRNVSQQPKI